MSETAWPSGDWTASDIRCPCNHGSDDICLNGLVYGSCGHQACGGGCTDVAPCLALPGCCDPERTR